MEDKPLSIPRPKGLSAAALLAGAPFLLMTIGMGAMLTLDPESRVLARSNPERVAFVLLVGLPGALASLFLLARHNWARRTLAVVYGLFVISALAAVALHVLTLGILAPWYLWYDMTEWLAGIHDSPEIRARAMRHVTGFWLPFVILLLSGGFVTYLLSSKLRYYCMGVTLDHLTADLTKPVEKDEANREPRLAAIWVLENLQDPASLAPLSAALGHRDPETRGAAAMALGNRRASGYVTALIDMLRDGNPSVRRRAATALGNIGDRSAHGPIREMLASEPDATVKTAAERACQRLQGTAK